MPKIVGGYGEPGAIPYQDADPNHKPSAKGQWDTALSESDAMNVVWDQKVIENKQTAIILILVPPLQFNTLKMPSFYQDRLRTNIGKQNSINDHPFVRSFVLYLLQMKEYKVYHKTWIDGVDGRQF